MRQVGIKLVDGYGVHLYPVSDRTQDMVQEATGALLPDMAAAVVGAAK